MKNTLGDLNNHLFAQLERLGDEAISEQDLAKEIERTKAISEVAKGIIANGNLVLQANKFRDSRMDIDEEVPKMLEG